ncbi:hypothetical protein [Caulobacter sp. DWP3-1-3b2]|uniref:hypothetical protein n=1 Tax=Caulobacter sp. DWP3-1-3b2 TaxID=2804643 RepID=UPI003CECD352
MTWHRINTTFTASEAERITGVSAARQRDWRRQGFLPALESGKAGFEAGMLAGMIAAKSLADAGVPPSAAWQLAKSCSEIMLARALNSGLGVHDPRSLRNEPLIHLSPVYLTADAKLPRYAITTDGRSWGWATTPAEVADHLNLVSVVLDLERAVDQLVSRARKPLVAIVEGQEA